MTTEEEIDRLVSQCLHGEASPEELTQLENLYSATPENKAHYLEAIDQQISLREVFVDISLQVQKTPSAKKTTALPLWALLSLIITFTVSFLFWGQTKPSQLTIKISPQSYGISLIRQQNEIQNINKLTLETDDLIRVNSNGQLWLTLEDGSLLYATANSILKVNQYSQEVFTLIKGTLKGKLKMQNKAFVFTTPDAEIRVYGTEFSTTKDDTKTTLSAHKGLIEVTDLKKGIVNKIVSPHSFNTQTRQTYSLEQNELSSLFPVLENGVRYKYHNLIPPFKADTNREIDSGITNKLAITRGDHEGFVRYNHDKYSSIHKENFHITLESLLKIKQDKKYTFLLEGIIDSSFTINGQKIIIDENKKKATLEISLQKGMYHIQFQTIGIIEADQQSYSAAIYLKDDQGNFIEIAGDDLFLRNTSPLPKTFADNNIDRALSAHLPLQGDFIDKLHQETIAAFGSPQFVNDERFGPVLNFDGKDDYLVHLPVDKLGMTHEYTAATWLKLAPANKHDQVLFANSSASDISSSLVLLIRRLHPYHAHLANDTIADEKVELGKWAHVVFRYHQGQQSIFLNGRLAVTSFNHNILASNNPLEIGRWSGRYLLGQLRDIRIYNAPLHSQDIKTLYEETKTK